jgi:hypothetical protein
MWALLVTGVAARLFSAPAANVASPQTWNSVGNAVQPMLPPQQVLVEVPVPQRSVSAGSGMTLCVALVAAAVGVVGGHQAMLFLGGGRSRAGPKDDQNNRTAGRPNFGGRGPPINRTANSGGVFTQYDQKKRNRYGATIQTQRNGFGTFIQSFQLAKGKSKYGVPIFLENGNINPAYLAAERNDQRTQSKRNSVKTEQKRKNLVKNNQFQLADYIRKAVGEVGSGQDYYQSGR